MEYKRSDILPLIDSFYQEDLTLESYEVQSILAIKCLTSLRFDLAFKLLYLEMRDKNAQFSKRIYQEHIRAFSLGKFAEPGNAEKNSIKKYLTEFNNIFKDIEYNGFDSKKSLVPMSNAGTILNGSHRVASAIILKERVKNIMLNRTCPVYDYDFFYKRNVPESTLDAVATKFIEYAENTYIAFIWPTAQGREKDLKGIIPNILYRKNIHLNFNGAHNLLSQIYYGEHWLGSEKNDFKGSKAKLLQCFKNLNPVRVIAFQASSLEDVSRIKDEVRAIFNVGKHSIHITDTKEESVRLARVVFNKNSIAFLNNARPNKYASTHKQIDKFKSFLVKNGINNSDTVLGEGIVLSAYGLRESSDIYYLLSDLAEVNFCGDELDNHNDILKFHEKSKEELIYDPKNYFYFNDLKFVSLELLYVMKKNRAEKKDINDCAIMESFKENRRFEVCFQRLKQNFYYKQLKIKNNIRRSLKATRLYDPIRNIISFFRK